MENRANPESKEEELELIKKLLGHARGRDRRSSPLYGTIRVEVPLDEGRRKGQRRGVQDVRQSNRPRLPPAGISEDSMDELDERCGTRVEMSDASRISSNRRTRRKPVHDLVRAGNHLLVSHVDPRIAVSISIQ